MLALRPAVVDFVDDITRRGGPDLLMENVSINAESVLVGQNVNELRECSKATVLAINKKNGGLIANPPGEEKISVGDSIIIVGTSEQLSSLEGICQGVKINV